MSGEDKHWKRSMGTQNGDESIMRMSFELERADNPPLFDELVKFPKGTKRLNRLRLLAHEGLMSQRAWTPSSATREQGTSSQSAEVDSGSDQIAMAAASSELFGPSIKG